MQIYIHHNNQKLGPLTEAEVKAQLASGTISLTDHAWWEGQATWIPLSQTPFAGLVPPPVPGIPGTVTQLNPMPGPHSSYEKTSNLALWSLICGVCSFLCAFTFLPAIILGHMGLSETKKNPALKGRGMAWAGLIIGYIMMVFFVVIVVISVLIALGNQVKSTFKTTSSQIQSSDSSDADSSTNSAPASTDSSTNSTPTVTP